MPGNVAFCAIPTVSGHPLVLPKVICKAFTRSEAWAANWNMYKNGETQRTALVTSARRTWRLTQRLKPTDAAALWTFVKTYKANAFYFYDPADAGVSAVPGSNYDSTGSNVTGRYTVRFGGEEFSETIYMARTESAIELVEIL
jgi:hypothetical protein